MKKITVLVLFALFAGLALAGSPIRGAQKGVAIDGYDTVAYFSKKAAVKGSPEYTHEWAGAKWFFSSAENRDLFSANPEKYAPQYGGHCALGVADGYLSRKSYEEEWEIVDDKLYLFPTRSARETWVRKGVYSNIRWGNQNWPTLKAKLETRRSRDEGRGAARPE